MLKAMIGTMVVMAVFIWASTSIGVETLSSEGIMDEVDIGNPGSEEGYDLVGWGPIEPTTHGGNWGGFGTTGETCRVVWYVDDDTPGYATVKLKPLGARKPQSIELRVLDGIGDDSFEVYVKNKKDTWTYVYEYTSDPSTAEYWVVHTIAIPEDVKPSDGTFVTLKVVSTAPPWSGFNTYGQLAVDRIAIY